jgi:hypothetical protein
MKKHPRDCISLAYYQIITLANYFMIDLIVRNGTTIDVNPLFSA